MADSPKPKKDLRIPVMMSADEAKAVDDWRFEHRALSRSDAIRQLVKLGLTVKVEGEK